MLLLASVISKFLTIGVPPIAHVLKYHFAHAFAHVFAHIFYKDV